MTNQELANDVAAARAANVPDAIIAEVVRHMSNGAPGEVARLAHGVFTTYGGGVEPRTLSAVIAHMAGPAPAPADQAAAQSQAPAAPSGPQTDEQQLASYQKTVRDWQSGGGSQGIGLAPVRK